MHSFVRSFLKLSLWNRKETFVNHLLRSASMRKPSGRIFPRVAELWLERLREANNQKERISVHWSTLNLKRVSWNTPRNKASPRRIYHQVKASTQGSPYPSPLYLRHILKNPLSLSLKEAKNHFIRNRPSHPLSWFPIQVRLKSLIRMVKAAKNRKRLQNQRERPNWNRTKMSIF